MKIKLPKPIMRDPNFLDSNSRKCAGPFRSKNAVRQKVKLADYEDEMADTKDPLACLKDIDLNSPEIQNILKEYQENADKELAKTMTLTGGFLPSCNCHCHERYKGK